MHYQVTRGFCGVQVGRVKNVLHSTHVTVRHVSTMDRVYRVMAMQARRSGVSALKGSGVRRASGQTHASVLRA